jgi:ADP-ribosylglycohydrolase
MNISYRTITLTKDNYNDYDLLDVVAISIAEPGAMGDPCAIEFITSKSRVFYANPANENISLEQIISACPILSEIKLGLFGCVKIPKGWKPTYLGAGNHLFIKESISEQFQLGTKQKQAEIKERGLYNNWKTIVEDCLDGTVYKNERVDKLKGVIYGQAIGDALGLATEFMDDAEMAQKYPNGVNDYSDIYQDAHRSRWKVGEWTDDTDMMLCIANAVIEDKGVNLYHIAKNFKAWADGEPLGIGNNTYKVLSFGDYVEKPFDAAKLVWEMSKKQSAANGGLMRTSVVGLFPKAVEQCAADICRLTHYDPRCVGSCVIVSSLIHSLVYDFELLSYHQIIDIANKYDERIAEYVDMSLNADIRALELQDEKSMGYTLKTLAASLWAYWNASSFEDGLLAVVNAGGDADTNAAVACAILGAKFGFGSIPKEYVEGLIHREKLDKVVEGIRILL